MLKLYGYKKCGTCRKAEKALTEAGVEYEYIDITENVPSKKYLKDVVKYSGLETKKAFNTSGVQYRELGMKDKIKEMSESEMIDLLSTNGKLCKRPMILDGEKATIGYKDGDFQDTWC